MSDPDHSISSIPSHRHIDLAYRRILTDVLRNGEDRPNRTGVGSRAIPAALFQYDLSCGPPILHGKEMSFRSIIVELAGFLQGQTSKKWYQDRGCNIWNQWCNPTKVPYSNSDPDIHAKMRAEDDLGPVYGAQWRNFMGQTFDACNDIDAPNGIDQLKKLVETLEKDPDSRRMLVSAWNPIEQPMMALPPCHFAWQVLVINGKLNLSWHQRSCDMFLGVPFNIASYGFLALLLCRQFNLQPGLLTGHLGDTHIYDNHREQVEEYRSRMLKPNNATLRFKESFSSVLTFEPEDVELVGYEPWDKIKAPIAI